MTVTVNGTTGVSLVQDSTITSAKVADASIVPADLAQPLTLGTAVASTSGTSIDFIGIPSWANRVTVMFNGVSTSGTSFIQVQVGAGSVTTSGYVGVLGVLGNAPSYGGHTLPNTGVQIEAVGTAITSSRQGNLVFTSLSGNLWTFTGIINEVGSPYNYINMVAGSISLAGALDRVRITTVNGTDTFDAGSINIMYE